MPPVLRTPPAIQWVASTQPGSYGFSSQKQTSFTPSLSNYRCAPVYFHRSATLDRIGCEITIAGAAGSVVRVGVHADNGNLRPKALLLDAGTVDSSTTGIKEITISLVVPAGVVWFGAVPQNGTSPGVRAISGSPPCNGDSSGDVINPLHSAFDAGVTGALTNFVAALADSNAGCPRIFWRIQP